MMFKTLFRVIFQNVLLFQTTITADGLTIVVGMRVIQLKRDGPDSFEGAIIYTENNDKSSQKKKKKKN